MSSVLSLMWLVLFATCRFTEGKITPESCKGVKWNPIVYNKTLVGHVIENTTVTNQGACEIRCFLNKMCLSYNYNTADRKCQLISAGNYTSTTALVKKPSSIYREIEVCAKLACQGMSTCLPDRINGDSCLLLPGDFLLQFPEKGNAGSVVAYGELPDLTSFTASAWFQSRKGSTKSELQSIISIYVNRATSGNGFGLHVTATDVSFFVMNVHISYSITLLDGKWHHVCVTWENGQGRWMLFVDGSAVENGIVSTGEELTEGNLVIGQEQDKKAGQFANTQSFLGNVTSVNIWSHVISDDEVRSLSRDCPSLAHGNVMGWEEVLHKIKGNVQVIKGKKCNL
ncbi:predicted protein [Nematostella vectensis]|uniref:Uncharacterized protein n=1 Tax=Nematostella vectensis TaxID=45351 RepID=A7S6R4_NEMVE|nr:predicted protein [Nematostella vectensis]|eukprot:XP_001632663.1 predicted protein [Nematostella vectensis]